MDEQFSTEPNVEQASERRARLYRAHAIVLRRRDIGEADRVVTVYTAEFGKRRVVARGSRRTSSRLAGHLEPFGAVRLLIARTRGLDIVSQAETIESFASLRRREETIVAAGYFAELVDELTLEDAQQEAVYDLLFASFRLLDDGREIRLVRLVFEMGLLRLLGYRPELHSCISCGAQIEPAANGFSDEGGVVCPACVHRRADARPVSIATLKLLRAIDRGDVDRLFALTVPRSVWAEVEDAMTRYLIRVTGKASRARQVAVELRLE
jgi:DNA repair protein RecO (recombination protein O)